MNCQLCSVMKRARPGASLQGLVVVGVRLSLLFDRILLLGFSLEPWGCRRTRQRRQQTRDLASSMSSCIRFSWAQCYWYRLLFVCFQSSHFPFSSKLATNVSVTGQHLAFPLASTCNRSTCNAVCPQHVYFPNRCNVSFSCPLIRNCCNAIVTNEMLLLEHQRAWVRWIWWKKWNNLQIYWCCKCRPDLSAGNKTHTHY